MNNSQVAHIWAQRVGGSKKGSNFYFEEDTIYSYGQHFPAGKFYDRSTGTCALLNCDNYSPTTARHMLYVRQSIRTAYVDFIAEVPNVEANFDTQKHKENLQYIVKSAWDMFNKCARARNGLREYVQETENLISLSNQYNSFFGLNIDIQLPIITDEKRAEFNERIVKVAKSLEEATERAEERERIRLNEWESDNSKRGIFRNHSVRLRIKDDKIQTSHGAEVPLMDGIAAAKAYLKEQLNVGRRIGHFTVANVFRDCVVIGCHTITKSEIEKLVSLTNGA